MNKLDEQARKSAKTVPVAQEMLNRKGVNSGWIRSEGFFDGLEFEVLK